MRGVTFAALLLATACGTRFVDLTQPGDAGGPQTGVADAGANVKCESVKRADGTECKICYGADGKLVDGSCLPVMPPPGMPPPDPAAAICKVLPMADTRCLSCTATTAYTVCLKCEAPIKTGATGEACRACLWNDQMDRCLQCFAADGTVTHDDCDTFRKEMFTKNVIPAPK